MVVGAITQQLERPVPGTYLGKGKIEELRERAEALNASLIIFDDELTPSQSKNIEDIVGRRVVDRAELILDIFAIRARSNEAKMQVELAQLEYMLPRLTRMWTHLEKFRGGIGVRGPGETQLETDRRLIGHRIRLLKERLQDVQRAREVQRHSRRNEFRAALVGYTNAGKSSILKAMSGAEEIHVEDRLFATLDPLTREADIGEGQRVLLTDTVGFIRKLPHHLVASFRATLEEATEADLLLHVIDASHPAWEEQQQVVDDVLHELKLDQRPVLHVLNKSDRMSADEVEALRGRAEQLLPGAIIVSATAEDGLDALRRALLGAVRRRRPLVEVRIPAGEGKLLAELHREAEVVEQSYDGDIVVMSVHAAPALLGRLRERGLVTPDDADAVPEPVRSKPAVA